MLKSANTVEWGPFQLRFDDGLLLVNGVRCELTRMQERLLKRLLRAAGRVVTTEELWGEFGVSGPLNSANIRVHIHALRQRLGNDGLHIVTFPSLGYGLGVEPEEQTKTITARRRRAAHVRRA